jgi:hypothetical protein
MMMSFQPAAMIAMPPCFSLAGCLAEFSSMPLPLIIFD